MPSDKLQSLIAIHSEYRTQARWLEDRRETASRIVIAANCVIIGYIVNLHFSIYCIILAGLIYILSDIGQFLSAKYFILSERDYARARLIRNKIDVLVSQKQGIIEELFREADLEENQNIWESRGRKYLSTVKDSSLHEKWMEIHRLFKIFGLVMAIVVSSLWFRTTPLAVELQHSATSALARPLLARAQDASRRPKAPAAGGSEHRH